MRYHLLGQTGLYVSELCLGTMTYGGSKGIWENIGSLQQDAVIEQVKFAVEAGINFIDTANVYSMGKSEMLLGQALKTLGLPREHLIIATKSTGTMDETPNGRGQSRHHIFNAIDASLKRLQLDYVDLYQLHGFDPLTPFEESLSALNDLVRSGRVRYIGLCNMAAWQIMKSLAVSDQKGLAKFVSVQAYYTIAGRDLEREVVPLLQDQKLGLMVWSPLAGGLLSGKYKGADDKGPSGARRTTFDFPVVEKERAFKCVDAMRPLAQQREVSVAQIALAWILSKPFVSTVIIGAKSMDQLRDNIAASRVQLTAEEIENARWGEPIAAGISRMDARAPIALAEALQIPVATSLNGKDTIPGNHPLSVGVVGSYSRESANRIVNAADLVCFIGTETGGMTTHFWAVPKIGTHAIQIDIEPEALGRNYPLAAAVNGDAKVTLAKMLAQCDRGTAGKRKAWVAEAQKICGAWQEKYKSALNSDAVPIRPERLCHELTKHVPDNGIVVVDTGHAGMWMGGMYDLTSPRQNYMRSAGHLGWAFPAGLGAKCACPDRPVVTFTGDAGFWYHIGEVETAVRWNINAVTVVNNNGGGNQSKRGFDRVYGGEQTQKARELWTFSKMNFACLAEDMGAVGIRVEKASEFPAALEKALAANRPAVIDVVTDIEVLAPTAVT